MNIDNKIREAFMRHENDVRPIPGAWKDVERGIGRHRRRRAIASGLGAAIIIAGAVVVVPRVIPDSSVTALAETPRLVAKIDASVYRLYAGRPGDAVWGLSTPAANGRVRDSLLRIDPRTNAVTLRVQLGENANAIADDGKSVWVTHNDGCTTGKVCATYETSPIPRNSVARFNRKTGRLIAAIDVYHPQAIVAAWGSIWVTTSGGRNDEIGTRVVRIDPATNKVTASTPLHGVTKSERYAPIGIGYRYVWVLPPTEDGYYFPTRIDPLNNGFSGYGVRLAGGDALMAVGSRGIWVTQSKRDSAPTLFRLNFPGTTEIAARIVLPEPAGVRVSGLVADKSFVWATTTNGHLWKISPTRNEPVGGAVTVGETNGTPAFDVASIPDVASDVDGYVRDSVWVASRDGKVWRFES